MKTPSFRFLWIGQTLANSGDIFYIVGLIALLYKITGTALFLAAVPLCIMIAKFISGMAAPIILDKWKLESLLFYSQGGKTALLLMLCFPSSSIYFIFILVFLISFLDGWAAPARSTLLPILVKEEELVRANSFVSTLDQSVQLGGWAVGGILAAAVGGQNLVWLTVLLFAISTFMMKGIHSGAVYEKPSVSLPKGALMIEGWLEIWKNPGLKAIHIILFLETAAGTVWIAALLYIYVKEQLHMGEEWWGYINASFFAGLILGRAISFQYARFLERHMYSLMAAGGFGIALSTLWFGITALPAAALAASALFGVMEQVKSVCMTTTLQKIAPRQLLPKIYSAQSTLIALVFGLGSVASGYLADKTDIGNVYIGAAALLALSAVYTLTRKVQFTKVQSK
ncbi:MFS transporter [Metabacillus sp. RGM 3146]|uniref:MFS transporter n=1 Tax=Metabacillus sp. RGM 3146 TaxID=3401092 RepID=UPI003B9D745E